MLIGYARVSTDDQNLDLQKDALNKAGCEKIFDDYMSGSKADRPGLIQALGHCRKGDTLVIWRLDRLGRSMRNLLELADTLKQRGIELKSLHEAIDTSTANGKMQFQLFGMLAEFERNLLIERTNAGLVAARARGIEGGRPKLLDIKKQERLVELYADRKHSVKDICSILGIGRTSLYNYLNAIESKKLRESVK
jgi:DNA invertase Pin-like site-specific DNA recombinase